MHDLESQVRTSLGIRLPVDYLVFMKRYGGKLACDPVIQKSWIPRLGDIFFVTGTTLAFRSRIPDFPMEHIIIGYAGTKLIKEINEEIDVYLMLDSRNESLHLVDSLGVSKALGENFKDWMNKNLRKVLVGERYANRLVVIGFDDEVKAGQLLCDLLRLQRDDMIDLEDAVAVVRKSNGKVKVDQTKSLTAKGALGGSMTGLVIGTLLLIPLIGAAVGAVAGAAAAALTDVGIGDPFIDEFAATLQPCTSALFVLVRRVNPDEIVKELRGRGGKVLVTTIGTEKEHELQSLLDSR